MSHIVLKTWHHLLRERNAAALPALLAEDAVFHSPVVHTPQRGRAITAAYLAAALKVLGNDKFRYVREIVGSHDAVLEFETEIDGIVLNGVDLIRWNDQNLITDFKVMVRPLKAINLLHQLMAAQLQAGKPAS
ncbi:MAG: nuclear transport factor 2 family protein [Burkholderiaceae bacterium]